MPDRAKAGGPTQRDYSATIVALKTTPDRERNELISAIVDADRRLRDSVRRFLSMLADALGEPFPADALASRSFDELLTSLEQHARAASFGRINELGASNRRGALGRTPAQRDLLERFGRRYDRALHGCVDA
ncbi:hypothetical protein [Caballeronia choica]|uniref:hypothetical protein n=1 Tax=Caballeronia choica TaxID=326476 RepID=UPI001F20D3F2|nr:hypothetical protein [Caballeronia choica]